MTESQLALTTTRSVIGEIAGVLEVPAESLREDVPLADVIPDSFVLVELAIELAGRFGFEFTLGDLERVRTIGDVVAVVERHGHAHT
jgi:acyl carrier protein